MAILLLAAAMIAQPMLDEPVQVFRTELAREKFIDNLMEAKAKELRQTIERVSDGKVTNQANRKVADALRKTLDTPAFKEELKVVDVIGQGVYAVHAELKPKKKKVEKPLHLTVRGFQMEPKYMKKLRIGDSVVLEHYWYIAKPNSRNVDRPKPFFREVPLARGYILILWTSRWLLPVEKS